MRSSAIALALLLAACQPVPQPFSHDPGAPPNALLQLDDARGIVVLPVADAPEPAASELARAVAGELLDRGIPAFTGPGNRASYFLLGHVIDPGHDAHILWTLKASDGGDVGAASEPIEGVPVAQWARADSTLIGDLAASSAARIATLIQPPVAREVVAPAVYVGEVTGVSDAVADRLRTALRHALAGFGTQTRLAPDPDALVARAEVRTSDIDATHREVEITWSLFDPRKRTVGTIRQSRALPRETIDGNWNEIAREAGASAAAGIHTLIDRIDWSDGFAPDEERDTPGNPGAPTR